MFSNANDARFIHIELYLHVLKVLYFPDIKQVNILQ